MCALTVQEASETYVSAMRNVLPAGPGICATCHCFIDSGYSHCYQCSHVLDSLDLVVPITYSEGLGQMHTALANYKRALSPEARNFARVRLLAILWRFLELHEHCLTNTLGIVGFDLVTNVPSSTPTRDQRNQLRTIARACGPIRRRYERLLIPAEGASDVRAFDPSRYLPQRSLTGESVLLIDDTWASGVHAQSAGYALKQAGANKIGMVVIGRHVNPDWEVGGQTSKAILDALPRSFDWETCAIHSG